MKVDGRADIGARKEKTKNMKEMLLWHSFSPSALKIEWKQLEIVPTQLSLPKKNKEYREIEY